jgi:hypothetical protein
MPLLRPGVGEQHKDARDRVLGKPGEHITRVAVMDADGGELRSVDLAEQARHAVDERLAADEAHLRMMLCLPEQMLARAEADLEPHFGNRRREQPGQGGGRL